MQRKISAESQIDAQRVKGKFRPETLNLEERTVEVVFTTGQEGKRWHWDLGYYLESLDVTDSAIRSERLDKGLSVIGDHDTWRGIEGVYGVTEAYRIENGELIGTVRFSSDEDADKVFKKVAEGVLRHVSLGYIVHRYEASITDDDSLDVYRAVDWEPTELSIVVVSFETTNGVRSQPCDKPAPEHLQQLTISLTGDDKDMKFRNMMLKYHTPAGTDGGDAGGGAPAAGGDNPEGGQQRKQPEQPPANPDGGQQRQQSTPAPAPAVDEAKVRALMARFAESAANAGFDAAHAMEAFGRNITIEAYNAELITAMGQRSAGNTPNLNLNSDDRQDHNEQQRKHIADSIMARAGLIEFTPETRQYGGARLMDLARHLGGKHTAGLGLHPMEVAKRAFQSTSDFPLILENVMNKTLRQGYTETPRTFIGLGTRSSVSDFRDKHSYMMGDAPSLLPLGENGEYKSGTIGESKESYAIETFARKIGFSRKMMVNDDLSALTVVPRAFGAAGSRLESDVVWGLLLNWDFRNNKAANFKMRDGKHLFDATHNNVLTGAASAFSKDSLSAMRVLGRKMKTLDGNFMNISWNTLVGSEDLETSFEEVLVNTLMANVTGETNSFRGKLDYRIEPRIAAVTGGDTKWMAFTNMISAFEYAYLMGDEGMYTEVNTSTDVDGLEILCRKDFGAGFSDYRGAAQSAGK